MSFYYNKLITLGADGIDFIDIGQVKRNNGVFNIIMSIPKEKMTDGFENYTLLSRTPYKFWKLNNGRKEYIDEETVE